MMRRREVITVLGGTVASWPLAARAQQAAMPVIGVLHRETWTPTRESFFAVMKRGLAEMGYVEGRNVAIEYRWAEGQSERLLPLAADLVRRKVSVIVAPANTPAALAAKTALAARDGRSGARHANGEVRFQIWKSRARPM